MLESNNKRNTSIQETIIYDDNYVNPPPTSITNSTTPTLILKLVGRMMFNSENVDDFHCAMSYRINSTFGISLSNDVDLAMVYAFVKKIVPSSLY